VRIWKWEINITDSQTVNMPVGAKLLDVQMQNSACCLWALCDQFNQYEERRIRFYGTGNPMPDDPGEYVATFQTFDGALVFHVFDMGANVELTRRPSGRSG